MCIRDSGAASAAKVRATRVSRVAQESRRMAKPAPSGHSGPRLSPASHQSNPRLTFSASCATSVSTTGLAVVGPRERGSGSV
eukprot:6994598-Alexandrium_andersonii.AAC.1